jgi:probable F420-dependent oxidoreductase
MEEAMQFGFNLPNSGALAEPELMLRIAREGEALGYDYLTVTDHVVLPDMAEPGYPYSESGAFYSTDSAHRHEMLTLAAWLAGMVPRLRLVLAVLVVPHRPAVLAAKQLATIDVLSGGRLTVGIGAGWLKAEFESVVATPFAERGAVTDEYVAAFRTLWTEKKPHIAGTSVHHAGLLLEPKPVQKPHPPIHVGGAFPQGARRAVRYGDGWIPTARGDLTVEIPALHKMAREAGRDPASIEITSFGLAEDVDRLKRLKEIGVARVVPMFPPEKSDKVLPIIDRWTKLMQQVNS